MAYFSWGFFSFYVTVIGIKLYLMLC